MKNQNSKAQSKQKTQENLFENICNMLTEQILKDKSVKNDEHLKHPSASVKSNPGESSQLKPKPETEKEAFFRIYSIILEQIKKDNQPQEDQATVKADCLAKTGQA
ncbi:MAG: hypothetical protein PHG00_09475 [Methylococcales bacterium]|nr:hypothetical protein [Methylococcales bacterium]